MNYLECQLVGLLAVYQILMLKDPKAIEQCEKIMIDTISRFDSTEDEQQQSTVFIDSIQADIRPYVYLGGVLSQNPDVSTGLHNYFLKYSDKLRELGHFQEIFQI
mmetsp:Transcript_2134/g.2741  ORF Transcript_2134/g.2741 Transcript_2134/m.2741 type:complete len:105 (-) Transcript_2134:526-840(-)